MTASRRQRLIGIHKNSYSSHDDELPALLRAWFSEHATIDKGRLADLLDINRKTLARHVEVGDLSYRQVGVGGVRPRKVFTAADAKEDKSMSIFKRQQSGRAASQVYSYEFQRGGRRFSGSTAESDKSKARAFERAESVDPKRSQRSHASSPDMGAQICLRGNLALVSSERSS